MKTDREAQAFRAAYDEMVDTTLPAPTWEELMDTATKPRETGTKQLPKYRRPIAIATASALLVALVIGGLALFGPLGGTDDMIDDPPVTTTATTVTETTAANLNTTAAPTTIPTSASHVVPQLGERWEPVLSTLPGDPLFLEAEALFPTDAGYYVMIQDRGAYLLTLEGSEWSLVAVDAPPGGFVTGGPGVVAWSNVGPETRTDAQLWVSSNGIEFERVGDDLLVGCGDASGCQGAQIFAAAASPDGRVVALAYDPLVWIPDCECFELNPVALVSDDGYAWARQPLDLRSLLPPAWQGEADIRSPLVYVDGRWLTYGTHYYNNGDTTDTAIFASENGLEWQLIDTGDLFDETYLMGITANDRGVLAITGQAAYWSSDGYEWTRTTLTGQDWLLKVAAYDNGYIAASSPRAPEGSPLRTIWYSPDGTTWSDMPLQFGEPTHWNAIVGNGPHLGAIGVTESNLRAVWRWTE